MQKVFINYARPDVDSARLLFKELRAIEGVEPWLDEISLLPGIKWKPAIRKAIREAHYFLALMSSRSSSARGYRHAELEQAVEILKEFPPDQVFVIPARLDDCQMPRDELSELNWIDLFPQWEPGVARLLSFLTSDPESGTNRSGASSIEPRVRTYHYRVGLVDLDLGLYDLTSLAEHLNDTQTFFQFTCPKLPSVKEAVVTIEGLTNLAVFKIPSSFYAEHPNLTVDLVACLTEYPLAFAEDDMILYNYFAGESDDDERFLFISTDQLSGFCARAGRTFDEGLIHSLVGQLVNYFTQIGYHVETRSCVMDHCKIRDHQIRGLRSRRFCDSCYNSLPDGDLKTALEALLLWKS